MIRIKDCTIADVENFAENTIKDSQLRLNKKQLDDLVTSILSNFIKYFVCPVVAFSPKETPVVPEPRKRLVIKRKGNPGDKEENRYLLTVREKTFDKRSVADKVKQDRANLTQTRSNIPVKTAGTSRSADNQNAARKSTSTKPTSSQRRGENVNIPHCNCSQHHEGNTTRPNHSQPSVFDRLYSLRKQTNTKLLTDTEKREEFIKKQREETRRWQENQRRLQQAPKCLACYEYRRTQIVTVFDRLYAGRKQSESKRLTDSEKRERYRQQQHEECLRSLRARRLQRSTFSSQDQLATDHTGNQSTPRRMEPQNSFHEDSVYESFSDSNNEDVPSDQTDETILEENRVLRDEACSFNIVADKREEKISNLSYYFGPGTSKN